ncbi:hypothetical protein TSUD_353130 [Trifolium subterraneum]|nr:hypothetical protein TSUD_353130 [Trifolium subterraneum]
MIYLNYYNVKILEQKLNLILELCNSINDFDKHFLGSGIFDKHAQVGLPDGIENFKDGTSPKMMGKISLGISMLRDTIELLFHYLQPDCIVSDMYYHWTVESAAKLGVQILHYYSSSYFSRCCYHFIMKHKPPENFVSDNEVFSIPGIPHNIEVTSLQLDEWMRSRNKFSDYMDTIYESEKKSYGTLYNSFHELEGDYEQLYKSTMGNKAWSVGQVSTCVNKGHDEDLAVDSEMLNWHNSKPNDSVLYVSFGSLTRLSHAQIVEITHGLENSGHNFIWVVRKKDEDGDEDEDGVFQTFEERMKDIKKAKRGGILTHCGRNSILESLNAGLPMITWPMFSEQFYNEKLLVDVLKIGVSVGSKANKFWWSLGEDALVRREEIAKAVVLLMGSEEESIEIRCRAKKLGIESNTTPPAIRGMDIEQA